MTEGLMRIMNDEQYFNTILEIKERLIKLENKVDSKITILENKIDNFNEYKNKTEDSLKIAQEALMIAKDVDKRVCKIEDNNKWLWRTTVGSAITILIGAIAVILKITN